MNLIGKRLMGMEERHWIYGGIALIMIWYLPFMILGENAHVRIHDNLDSVLVSSKILLDNHAVFADPTTKVEQVMNGLPRSAFPAYDLSLLWFYLFGMFKGYVINKWIMAFVAFFGMYLLLKRYVIPEDKTAFLRPAIALLYGLLPFWSFTLSVAGLPLLAYVFLNLRFHNATFKDWLLIIIYGFYSSLVLTGLFIFVLMGLMMFYDIVRTKKIAWQLLAGLCVLGVSFVISHLPIFYSILSGKGEISHRTEFTYEGLSLFRSLQEAISVFLFGQYHAHSLHTLLVLPVFIGVFLLWQKGKLKHSYRMMFLFLMITSLFYGMLSWVGFLNVKTKLMAVFPVQLQRFHFFHPLVWFVLTAIVFAFFVVEYRRGRVVVLFCILAQLGYLCLHHELIENRHALSYREFYAADQLELIKEKIGKPLASYRVVSVGFHPAMAQYNGFYTLDGYFPDYPLTYKHQFRKIIEGEIEKSADLRKYFDDWGSRCYVFSAELGTDIPGSGFQNRAIEEFSLDYDQLLSMQAKYVLSAVPINIEKNNRLKWIETFHRLPSRQHIYLYEIQ